ncbi:hypothetical protein [Goekera deserti]|nr:hypothetical protein [Goekera deserti]
MESRTVSRSVSAFSAAPTMTRKTLIHSHSMLIATPASGPYVDS